MLLFVYNRSREIFGNAQETFLFAVEKQKTYSQILSYKLQFLSCLLVFSHRVLVAVKNRTTSKFRVHPYEQYYNKNFNIDDNIFAWV